MAFFKKTWLVIVTACLLLAVAPVNAGWLDKLNEFLGDNNASAGSASGDSASTVLSNTDISQAFKEALTIGSQQVVQQLGSADGFNLDPAVHIPLPSQLNSAREWLAKVGMSDSLDDLEVRLNRAAEAAMPQARDLFVDAIQQMTFDDVRTIYNGPEDSATQYLRTKMTPGLTEAMAPVISDSLSQVGAINRYDEVMGAYQSIPFVPDIKADLTAHVVNGGLQGMFHYLAQQEAAIRRDPVRQTTALLKKVFGVE